MLLIRSKQQVLDLAAVHAPTSACAAVIRGVSGVTFLGAFNGIEGLPGWLVRVQSDTGKVWLIGVVVDENARKIRIKYPDSIPWGGWLGESNGKRPLRDGEVPGLASFYRMKAHAKQSSTVHSGLGNDGPADPRPDEGRP